MGKMGGFIRLRQAGGFSLTELMVTVAVLTVGAMGLMGVFGGISRGVQAAKSRSLATNLAQERIQILKQKNYYRVLVTTAPAYITDYTPPVPYDPYYFPPEEIVEGGIPFTRYTLVEPAQEISGEVMPVPPTSGDTNMKVVTVTVAWRAGDRHSKVQMRNVMSNMDATVANSILRGQVTPISAAALITVAENTGWQDTTDAGGNYLMNLFPGNYTLTASAPGYFPQRESVTVTTASVVTRDIALTPMAYKTVTGEVWTNRHLVISQVMGSTANLAGFSQEYVEVYNPTTWTWTMAGRIGLKFQRRDVQDAVPVDIAIDYTGSPATLDPGRFYLFANTSPVIVGGFSLVPDAVWENAPAGPNATNFAPRFVTAPGAEDYNVITVAGDLGGGHAAGGLQLYDTVTGVVFDRLGWRGNGSLDPAAAVFETQAINQVIGLQSGELYFRKVHAALFNPAYGPAYDSDNNNDDVDSGVTYLPRNTASAAVPVISGTPAVGAVVSSNDGYSIPTQAVAVGSPPVARFTLTNVATGTWTVFASLDSDYQEIANVVVSTGGGSMSIPDAATVPAWPAVGFNSVLLSTTTEEGFVSGTVVNVLGAPISPGILVTNGGRTTTAATSGSGAYLLKLPAGTFAITANPSNASASYVTASSAAVNVVAGAVTSNVNFTLSQGGQILGFVTRDGVNPLPGCAVRATNMVGVVASQQVTGPDGRYRMINLATGTYEVEPTLASGENATPGALTTTVSLGAQVFAGTFTIRGASGFIHGSAAAGGQAVKTGVTVVATTTTLASGPVNLNTAAMAGAAYYTTSTDEDGTFTLEVRGSTTTPYRVYAYYPVRSGVGWTINSASSAGVMVTPGMTYPGVDFAW